MQSRQKLYHDKLKQYYLNIREDIISLVPEGPNKVLEVGCGQGETLFELKRRNLAAEIVGVDILPAENQLDHFICGDIEEMTLPYPDNYFNVIICADVLEHLIDPWNTAMELAKLLKPEGLFIASIPNIRFFKAFIKIYLKGDFGYEDQEIFDRSHLRFFCKKNMIALLDNAGLEIDHIYYDLGKKKKLFNKLTLNLFLDILVFQYIIAARKK